MDATLNEALCVWQITCEYTVCGKSNDTGLEQISLSAYQQWSYGTVYA